tara:strand:- start:1302 stop:1616 length:315 start_codon:yes stop_codon:yes gene_type:complete
MELVEKKLALLEKESQQINNGEKVLGEISQLVKNKVIESVRAANETDSIDDRIQTLVNGYQEILNTVNQYQAQFADLTNTLQTKISVLEEVLDSYIENEASDLD